MSCQILIADEVGVTDSVVSTLTADEVGVTDHVMSILTADKVGVTDSAKHTGVERTGTASPWSYLSSVRP